ncbi:MAG: hypothetical protein PSX79_09030, partial [bacterium]|nr:hypothetical protein [bacterium]
KDTRVPNSSFPSRLATMIRLALLPDGASPEDVLRSERLAQAAGLTGAEIDAARHGRSFDVGANAAINLAQSIALQDPGMIAHQRVQASASGLSPADILAVERETLRLLPPPN